MLNISSFILILSLILFSCHQSNEPESKKKLIKDKNSLVEINKFLVQKDAEAIENYIERRKWKMQATESGLYYMIYKNGNGKHAKNGSLATIISELSLLDGTICYKVDSLNPKSFIIGKGGVESGLEQGILLLREGDKAKFIMPPHLAHGLTGDENKIPPRSTIVYDIELIKIKEEYE
ncbi:FKBP-type peptidyl-prolyl cis-trans isomerase [Bacteroidota bacterium]